MVTVKPSSFGRNLQCFERGQKIFAEGQSGEVMYVVVEGQVDLFIEGTLIERVGPNGVLGEMALLDAAPRAATAVAHSTCRLIPINRKKFSFMIQQTPEFALQVMRVMTHRLRHMDERLHHGERAVYRTEAATA